MRSFRLDDWFTYQERLVFSDKLKSISKCINRFDDDTRGTFLDLYTKVDSGADAESLLTADETPETPEADEVINISS